MNNKQIIKMIKNGWNLIEIKFLLLESYHFEKELVRKRKEVN